MRSASNSTTPSAPAESSARSTRVRSPCAVADDVDRRPGERRDQQEDVEGLARKAGEAAAEQVAQAVRHVERLARRGPRARSDEFATEFQCEEGVAGRRFLYPCQFGSGELEPEPLLEEPVNAAEAERADRELLEPLPGERRSSSKGIAASSPVLWVANSPTGSSRSRRSAILITPAEAGRATACHRPR